MPSHISLAIWNCILLPTYLSRIFLKVDQFQLKKKILLNQIFLCFILQDTKICEMESLLKIIFILPPLLRRMRRILLSQITYSTNLHPKFLQRNCTLLMLFQRHCQQLLVFDTKCQELRIQQRMMMEQTLIVFDCIHLLCNSIQYHRISGKSLNFYS